MNKIIVIVLALGLVGCSVSLTPKEYEWGESVCTGNGGLKSLEVFDTLYPNAVCHNGAMFSSHGKDFTGE